MLLSGAVAMLVILLLLVIVTLILLITIIAKVIKASILIKKSLLTFSFISAIAISLLLVIQLQKIDYKFDLANLLESSAEKVSFFVNFDELKPKEFGVYSQGKYIEDYATFEEAVNFAKESSSGAQIHYRTPSAVVWQENKNKPVKVILDVPIISQLPELPRGCEVTSLAMMLEYSGAQADKLILAKEVIKDETPYEIRDGSIYFGNPYSGFVGNMYDIDQPGYGVYHGPIRDLAENYIPNKVVDMTGAPFDSVLYPLTQGRPVWVVINTLYIKLDASQFEKWLTPNGPIQITYRMHAVVITGYDNDTIYFNDPLTNIKNRQISRKSFEEAWIQMGKQAISFIE